MKDKLLELGNKENKSIYLFGSKQEVIDSMKNVLKRVQILFVKLVMMELREIIVANLFLFGTSLLRPLRLETR